MTKDEALKKMQAVKSYMTSGNPIWSVTEMGEAFDMAIEALSAQPERKTGKWEEKHHAYADEEKVIEEWQSCRCSVCGRYDTRPYMYYFDEPHFCSWCGADMRGEEGCLMKA